MNDVEAVVINKVPAGPLFRLVFIITTISLIMIVAVATVLSDLRQEGAVSGKMFGVEFVGYFEALIHALWGVPLLTLMFSPIVFLLSFLSLKIYCWKKPLGLVIGRKHLSFRSLDSEGSH